MTKSLGSVAIYGMRAYQILVSPLLTVLFPGLGCRYQPTCSEFAKEAIEKHGFFRGSLLSLRRVASCHPWSRRDRVDPVS